MYTVYFVTNPTHTVLYIGFTSDLIRRIDQHRNKVVEGFTADYNAYKLVYFEVGENYDSMLAREKQLKKWSRKKKEVLINRLNPQWEDLFPKLVNEELDERFFIEQDGRRAI